MKYSVPKWWILHIFQKAAEQLQIWLHAFQALPEDQKEVLCLKLLLEVLALLFMIWLGKRVSHAGKRKPKQKTTAGKIFRPKKWRTDGSYYDEEKKEWVGPDFR